MKHSYRFQVGFCKTRESCAWRRNVERFLCLPRLCWRGRALHQPGAPRRQCLEEPLPHKVNVTPQPAPPLCPPTREILPLQLSPSFWEQSVLRLLSVQGAGAEKKALRYGQEQVTEKPRGTRMKTDRVRKMVNDFSPEQETTSALLLPPESQ